MDDRPGLRLYMPSQEEVDQWKAEAAKARGIGGAKAPNGAALSTEKRGSDTRPFENMSQKELVERAVRLRRRLGKEFADDDEVENERPR